MLRAQGGTVVAAAAVAAAAGMEAGPLVYHRPDAVAAAGADVCWANTCGFVAVRDPALLPSLQAAIAVGLAAQS